MRDDELVVGCLVYIKSAEKLVGATQGSRFYARGVSIHCDNTLLDQ